MSGQDLAELRTGKQRRNRAKVDQRLAAERAETQAKRRKTARGIQSRAEAGRMIDRIRHRAARILPGLAALVLLACVVLGTVYWYTHPTLSEAQVVEGLQPITVRVEKRLGVSVETRSIERRGSSYVVDYRVREGARSFGGRRVLSRCSARATIAASQRLPITDFSYTTRPCRFSRLAT